MLGFTALCALILGGCVVGPNYKRPSVQTPPAWKEQPPEGWKTATPHDEISKGNWWVIFGDPELNDLETQAIAANQNLQAAAQRVIEARAQALATRSNLFPSISAGFSPSRSRTSGRRPLQPGSFERAFTANTFTLPIQASYELDLWGQIRRSVESANALTQRSVADYENVLLQLKSDVASFYIMAHYISAAATLLNTTQATYVGLRVQRGQFEHALAVLLGKAPAEFSLPEKPLQIAPPAAACRRAFGCARTPARYRRSREAYGFE